MAVRSRVLREGCVSGVLGASVVALWFLLVDTLAGAPFFTPTMLGAALLRVDPATAAPGLAFGLVAAYTVFHFAAFLGVGTLAAFLIQAAEREPALFAAFFIFFVVFQTGFYGLVAVLNAVQLLHGMEWYQIAVGNLLASAVMGGYLWHAHPALKPGLADALSR